MTKKLKKCPICNSQRVTYSQDMFRCVKCAYAWKNNYLLKGGVKNE